MARGKILTEAEAIKRVLLESKTVAVVGMSPKPQRDSHMVGKYLIAAGYTVLPIRPAQKEILGARAYHCLDDVTGPVDIVTVFRRSEQVMTHAREALRLSPKLFWMQLNIENSEAADLLCSNGIDVVMNRCIKVEHEVLIKQIIL